MQRTAALLFLTCGLLLACRRHGPSEPSAPRPTARATHPTRYRAGEFVVYRYSGKAVPRLVTLREEMVDESKEGITLDVVIDRERERADVADRQHFQKVVSGATVDLYRFMAWNLVLTEGQPKEEKKTTEEIDIGGRRLRCEVTNGTARVRGKKVRFATSACPDFLWTYGPARYWDEATNETLLSIEVVETGTDPDVGR